MKVTVRIDDQYYTVEIPDLYSRPIVARVDGEEFEIWPEGSAPAASEEAAALPSRQPPSPSPFTGIAAPLGALQPREVRAPMPGTIVAIKVAPGESVQRGQELLVLEAMKMRNTIRAGRDGRVSAVRVSPGQTVNHNDVLVELEE